jgi:hypothetical protein
MMPFKVAIVCQNDRQSKIAPVRTGRAKHLSAVAPISIGAVKAEGGTVLVVKKPASSACLE